MLVVPSVDFVRAYSGTAYLLQELHARGVTVEVAMRTTSELAPEYHALPFRCALWTLWSPAWGRLRRLIAGVACRIWIVMKMLPQRHILITDSLFLAEAALVKRLRGRNVTLIQFCQELQLLADYPSYKWARVYNAYARVPDYVIDVDPLRAAIRAERLGLRRKPFVLRNTLPLSAMPPRGKPGRLAELADLPNFDGLPVALYTGGTGKERPLERVIDAVAQAHGRVFLLVFCSATSGELDRLRRYAADRLPSDRYRICPAIKRSDLLAATWEADIGIVDYTFSVEPTLNQKHCAPTKLYEYMASGLTVLGSNNDSLRSIIETERIGACAVEDSVGALAQALTQLLADPMALREMKLRAAACFAAKYAWDKMCSPVIVKMIQDAGLALQR